MPEINLRSELNAPDRHAVRRRFRTEASRIARAYDDALTEYELACRTNEAGQFHFGDRTIKRIPVPPFLRPDNLLKRSVYALAHGIHDRHKLEVEIERLVRARDRGNNARRIHRPREGTAVDWVLRMVTGHRARRKDGSEREFAVHKLSSTQLSRWAVELNFALECGVRPEFVIMFIDHVGGHELISAGVLQEKNHPQTQPWWRGVTREMPRLESKSARRNRKAIENLSEISMANSQADYELSSDDGWN